MRLPIQRGCHQLAVDEAVDDLDAGPALAPDAAAARRSADRQRVDLVLHDLRHLKVVAKRGDVDADLGRSGVAGARRAAQHRIDAHDVDAERAFGEVGEAVAERVRPVPGAGQRAGAGERDLHVGERARAARRSPTP
jgi:hypothetical protein